MAQMTFLQMAQRLALDCGETRTGLTTVVGQSGRLLRCVNAIASAWLDIQQQHQDWRFLRLSTSFLTIDGQPTYTVTECGLTAGTLGMWVRDSFRVYLTSAGLGNETHLSFCHYDLWRDRYQIAALRSVKTRPTEITITPNDGLGLGLTPAVGYTVLGDYYRAPVTLTADGDVPALPEKHDAMIIVYRAMQLFGNYLGAPELVGLGKDEYRMRMPALEKDQLPPLRFAA